MSRVTFKQFMTEFRNGEVPINVNELSPDTLSKLKKAGIDVTDLKRIAGNDGKIKDKEYETLYKYVDGFEDGPPNDYFETKDSKNVPTTSGEVYDALKAEFNRNAAKAKVQPPPKPVDQFAANSAADINLGNQIIKNSPKVPGNDQHAAHISDVKKQLQKEKLPTSAKGVSVIVIGETDTDHAAAIARTIAGPVGLAKDANVHVQKDGGFREKYVDNHPYTKEFQGKSKGATITITDLAKLGVVQSEAMLHDAKEEMAAINKKLPADGKTRIGNISWGHAPVEIATRVNTIITTNDPIFKRAQLEWEKKTGNKFDRTSSVDEMFVRAHLADRVADEMKTLQNEKGNKETFTKLQTGLEKELSDARKKGLLVFNAAGNDREVADTLGDPSKSAIFFDSVKGFVTVGAADLKTAKNKNDDSMWNGSAEGKRVAIAAPGVNIPAGVSNNKSVGVTGTSFASPYAASVAALMVAANPKITPDQIEAILTSGRVTNDLAGTADGKGLLDPVKALKEAKNLATN